MRFMMTIKSDAQSEAGVLPDDKVIADMSRLNQDMVKAGVRLVAEGLQPSSKGARVRLSGKKVTVIDGPFAEAKEVIAGFWLLQTRSREEALDWARRVPSGGEVELRAVYELSDFPVDPSEQAEGWRDQEQRFREGADAAAAAGQQPARKPGTKRFMVMLKGDRMTESGVTPDQKTLAAMGALMDELARSGTLLSGEGLKPTRDGAKIRSSGTKRTVIDGPFTESKEFIAGYSMIQVASKQEAIEFAKRWIKIHEEASRLGEAEIEIRQVFELSDFPAETAAKVDGWRTQEQR